MTSMLMGARLRLAFVAGLLGVGLVVAGCGSSSSSSSAAASKPPASVSPSPAPASATAVSVSTMKGSSGTFLVSSGRTLYLWVADSPGRSSCSGACAAAWPPLLSQAKPTASAGVSAAALGRITRSDGSEQVTYKGHPLYFFAGDTGPGMVTGQGSDGFGAKWWLVAPSGSAITTSASATSAGGSGAASSGGGY